MRVRTVQVGYAKSALARNKNKSPHKESQQKQAQISWQSWDYFLFFRSTSTQPLAWDDSKRFRDEDAIAGRGNILQAYRIGRPLGAPLLWQAVARGATRSRQAAMCSDHQKPKAARLPIGQLCQVANSTKSRALQEYLKCQLRQTCQTSPICNDLYTF